MQKRKIIKNSYLMDLKDNIQDIEQTNTLNHLSEFDFESHEFTEAEKKFIQERESKLVKEFKKNSESLYEICISILEMQDFFKNNFNNKFVAWYTHAGLNKDKISEYTKRAELYINFPEKKALISNITCEGLKALTKKGTSIEKQKEVLELSYTAKKDILTIVGKKDEAEKLHKYKYYDIVLANRLMNDIKKRKDLHVIKDEIENFKILIKVIEDELFTIDKELENKSNIKLIE
ncbi:MAG: hypothetical protein ACRCZ0_05675 [Cetobacterium sp.]